MSRIGKLLVLASLFGLALALATAGEAEKRIEAEIKKLKGAVIRDKEKGIVGVERFGSRD